MSYLLHIMVVYCKSSLRQIRATRIVLWIYVDLILTFKSWLLRNCSALIYIFRDALKAEKKMTKPRDTDCWRQRNLQTIDSMVIFTPSPMVSSRILICITLQETLEAFLPLERVTFTTSDEYSLKSFARDNKCHFALLLTPCASQSVTERGK
jgi:hypothetical protein